MPWTENAKNGMLGQARARITHLSLHNGNPGLTGANEIADVGYVRAAVTVAKFTAPAAGEFELNENLPFTADPSRAVSHVGAWDGATFLGNGALAGDATFSVAGQYMLKVGTAFHLNAVA